MAVEGKKVTVSHKLEENVAWLSQELGVETSFDMVCREITVGGKDAALFFIDGFAKDQIMLYIMETLARLEREQLVPETIQKLLKRWINYIEVQTVDDLHQAVDAILSGTVALLVEGENQAVIIDAREYPVRSPEEPDIEKVVRGSRDGFVETIVFNTALIRRRVRDPRLRMELLQAGQRSKTDICVAYIEDIADPKIIDAVKDKIKAVKIDGLPMAEKSVEELITTGSMWNPFPRVRYTERPDVAAQHILEGHILVIVDTSPSVIILPATLFHHLQHAEEYRQVPLVGAFLRWVRFGGIAISLLIAPLYLLFSLHPELLPPSLAFIGPKELGEVPLILQFVLAELGINLMRLAAVHTPASLTTALSLIAALLIGDIAVSVGLFNQEVVLYTAVAAVGVFSTPSYELAMANNLVRLLLLLVVWAFGLPGLVVGLLILTTFLARTKSFGIPYLWPLFPFNWAALKAILVRSPVPIQNTRPSILKPQDPDRQPPRLAEPAHKPDRRQRTGKNK